MPLKFTIEREKVVIDKNILLLKEFSDILEYGQKKKKPELANKILLYIFFCCDLSEDNVMRDLDYRLKPEQARSRTLGRDYKFSKIEEELINAGFDAYNFFNEKAPERAEMVLDKKIDETRALMESTAPETVRNVNATTGAITFTSNVEILGSFAKQIENFMEAKLRMKQTALKIENTGRVRGNKGSSMIERGNLAKLAQEFTDDAED